VILEHVDLLLAVLAMLGGMLGAVAMGGHHVGRITQELRSLGKTLLTGFNQNHDEHAAIDKKLDQHAERITKIETKVEGRIQ